MEKRSRPLVPDVPDMVHGFKMEAHYTVQSSGRVFWIRHGVFHVLREDIQLDADYVRTLCKQCKNHGVAGGCPPVAPTFDKLKSSYPHCLVYWLEITPEDYKQFHHMPVYYQLTTGDYMTANMMVRLCKGWLSVAGEDAYWIGAGNCRACKGKKCPHKETGVCTKPNERTYSMEATGINVCRLMHFAGVDLVWRYPGHNTVHNMVRVSCFLRKDFNPERDFGKFKMYLKSQFGRIRDV